jgi:hypothetical protein
MYLGIEDMTPERLQALGSMNIYAAKQEGIRTAQARQQAQLQHFEDMKTQGEARNEIMRITANAAKMRAGVDAGRLAAQVKGGTFTRPEALDFSTLVETPESPYYQQPDLALQHLQGVKAAQAKLGKASVEDQAALAKGKLIDTFLKNKDNGGKLPDNLKSIMATRDQYTTEDAATSPAPTAVTIPPKKAPAAQATPKKQSLVGTRTRYADGTYDKNGGGHIVVKDGKVIKED